MEKKEHKNNRYGLLGKNIAYSFSKGYFTQKFKDLGLHDHSYENFDLKDIQEVEHMFTKNTAIKGFNVTIPYKEAIIPYLTEIDQKAKKIGAVNTVKITKNGLKGYNTDAYGFKKSIDPFLQKSHTRALILGTGGASKAVAFVFDECDIPYTYVSRHPKQQQLSYTNLTKEIMASHSIIVNCTPLGTHPNILESPNIPYAFIQKGHLLYDLIYNPEKTTFLEEGEKRGAQISNGLSMLQLQAEKSWEIWNS